MLHNSLAHLRLSPPTGAPPALDIALDRGKSRAELSLTGQFNVRYVIQISDNLRDWHVWKTVAATGSVTPIPLPQSTMTRTFYRARPAWIY